MIQSDFFSSHLEKLLQKYPLEFAYILRLLEVKNHITKDYVATKDYSVFPSRIVYELPEIHHVFHLLFQHKKYDAKKELKHFF